VLLTTSAQSPHLIPAPNESWRSFNSKSGATIRSHPNTRGWSSSMKIAVTLAEATHLSGIGRSSLYKLFLEGKLKPRKSGRRTLILLDDLKRHLENLPAAY
jgi:hypothetical protein